MNKIFAQNAQYIQQTRNSQHPAANNHQTTGVW